MFPKATWATIIDSDLEGGLVTGRGTHFDLDLLNI